MVHKEFLRQPVEEVLEEIWCRRELEEDSVAGLISGSKEPEVETILQELVKKDYISLEDDRVELKPRGNARAGKVVRRHRLAERLLLDLFDLNQEEGERAACLMEHILSPVVTDAVCTFLGHPPTCPHGRAIPQGLCCREPDGAVKPVIFRLSELAPGQPARITLIAHTAQKRMDRLGSFGLVPGTKVTLRQRHPAMVIEMEGSSLALDSEIAGEIYVRHEPY